MTDAKRILELEAALRERDARIADLERKIAELEKVIDAWKRGHRVRAGSKLAQKAKRDRTTKGRGPGRPEGHAGASRPAPDHVDRDVTVPPPCRCPDCGGEVEPLPLEAGAQHVEDIVPGHVEVTKYVRVPGCCKRCGTRVVPPMPDGLGDNPKVGARTQSTIVEAKNDMGLSHGRIQQMLDVHYGMSISRGGIQQILHRAATVTEPALEQIRTEIAASSEAWADETSLKVAGKSGYLWLVMTRVATLFHADDSRATEVAEEMLAAFHGTLHTDFYAVYWAIDHIEHAPCWGHLVRAARQVAERDPTPQTEPFALELKRLYVRGVLAQSKGGKHAARAARQIHRALGVLALRRDLARHADVARLQSRIVRHHDELVVFITNPALEATNNRSEREFRPIAMARHTSGGARSDQGAKTFATNRSIVRTAALNEIDYHSFLRDARIAAKTGAPFPTLIKPRARPPPN